MIQMREKKKKPEAFTQANPSGFLTGSIPTISYPYSLQIQICPHYRTSSY